MSIIEVVDCARGPTGLKSATKVRIRIDGRAVNDAEKNSTISGPNPCRLLGPIPSAGNRVNNKSYLDVSGLLVFLAMLGWFGRDGSRIGSPLYDIVVAVVGFVLLGICLWAGRGRARSVVRADELGGTDSRPRGWRCGDRPPRGTNACVGFGTIRRESERVTKEAKLRRLRLVLPTAAMAAIAGASGVYLYRASAPARAEAAFKEGMLRMGAGDYEGAVERFSQAVSIWPRMAAGYFERGVARASMHKADAAIEDLERAISKDSSMASAHTALGTIYRERGNLTRAMDEFALSLQLSTSTEAFYERGQVHESLGQHQRAIEDYDAAIHEQPDAPYVYRARAMSLDALGNHEGAIKDRTAFGHRCLDRDLSESCF
jgi:regulator of sirC expression with transglutaminase-like and TPR domain